MLEPLVFFSGMLVALIIIYFSFLIWKKRTETVLSALEQRLLRPGADVISEAEASLERLNSTAGNLESLFQRIQFFLTELDKLSSKTDKISQASELLESRLNELRPLLNGFLAVERTLKDYAKKGVQAVTETTADHRIILVLPKDPSMPERVRTLIKEAYQRLATPKGND